MFNRASLYVVGQLVTLVSICMVVPGFFSLAHGDLDTLGAFAGASGAGLFLGIGAIAASRGDRDSLGRRDILFLMVLGWFVAPLFAALPFWFGQIAPSFADAYLEAVSGLTTTGLSVFQSPEALSPGYLIWRALTQWLGGFAIVALGLTFLPILGMGGADVIAGAAAGRAAGLRPAAVRSVLRQLVTIYGGMTALCAFALMAVGVESFEALCLAMSTVSTGGFSTRSGAIDTVGGPGVLLVLIPFMIAGALSFHIFLAAASSRRLGATKSPELISFGIFLAIGALIAIPLGFRFDDRPLENIILSGVFDSVAALSTTGFRSEGIAGTTVVATFLFAGMALIGASTGSTGGGIKQMRVVILLKQVGRHLRILIHPNAVVGVKFGGAPVSSDAVRSAWTYFAAFLIALILLTVALTIVDLRFSEALALASAVITNGGQIVAGSAGAIAWQSAVDSNAEWLLSIGMVLGRLELLTVMVLFSRGYWQR